MKKILLAILAAFCMLSCSKETSNSNGLENFIPLQSTVIIKVNDWEELSNSLQSNNLITALNHTPAYETLSESTKNLSSITPSGPVWLCFVPLGKAEYDLAFITKYNASDLKIDSLRQKNITTRNYEDVAISTLSENNKDLHFINLNNTLIASTSPLLLENTIRNQNNKELLPEEFIKIASTADNDAIANIFMPAEGASSLFDELFPRKRNTIKNKFSWIGLDLYDKNASLQFNGVLLPGTTNKTTLSLLKDVKPATNKIAEILPSSAIGAVSLNYTNWDQYKKNLANYRGIQPADLQLPEEDLLANATEISKIHLADGSITALAFPDTEASLEFIAPIQETDETFREVEIFKIADSTFLSKSFKEIIAPETASYMCRTEQYMAFAKSKNLLQTLITNLKNNSYLAQQSNFETFRSHLAGRTSLQLLGNTDQVLEKVKESVSAEAKPSIEALKLDDYPFGIIQLTQENGFMHVNALAERNTIKPEAGAVSQLASIKLEADLAIAPQLVRNHRTEGSDIAVQDVNNVLYLINNKGKILWKKQLDNRILGKIKQIDLYKNGRLQLAFATASSLRIIDREGNDVKPYPLKFEDQVTQPLALFDYDGNRNYRMIITQGDKLLMYNTDGKIVKGFKYTDAGSALLFAPKHIRIGTKDYIVVQLSNGKLKILDRTGDVRVDVAETFDFGSTSTQEGDKNFKLYDAKGSLITISEKGNIKQDPPVESNEILHKTTDKVKATLIGNMLTINGKTSELDFGLYTGLNIFKVGNKEYISLTDDQSKQVYLFSAKGELLPNFPIYGNSAASIANLQKGKNPGIVVKGEKNTILLYQINP